MRLKNIFGYTLFYLSSLSGTSVQADQPDWLISREQAECILANLDAYRSATQEPVVIFVKACPIVDPQQAMASLQINSALPQVRESQDTSLLDEIIVFSYDEIECLTSIQIKGSAAFTSIPRKPCDD